MAVITTAGIQEMAMGREAAAGTHANAGAEEAAGAKDPEEAFTMGLKRTGTALVVPQTAEARAEDEDICTLNERVLAQWHPVYEMN